MTVRRFGLAGPARLGLVALGLGSVLWAAGSGGATAPPGRLVDPVAPAAGAPAPPPAGELARCKALIDAGQPQAARARLQPLVEAHPQWARAIGLLGLTYYKESRFEVAAELFARALAADPAEDAVLPYLGWSRYALGQLDGAEAAFRALLERRPDFAPAQEALARITRERGVRVVGAAAGATGALRFREIAGAGGIDVVMQHGAMPSREILEVNGGGVALFDYDRDGDLDVFLANGATMADPEHGPGSRLYANRGDASFVDVTRAAGIELRRWANGVAVGDVDGDGWDDLYVTCFGANVLLRNEAGADGQRRFRDVAVEAGVADPRWSTSAAFGDLDADGDLDLYVVNYLVFDPAHPPSRAGKAYRGVPVMAGPRGTRAEADALYENLGNGRFRDVSAAAGLVTAPDLDYGLTVRIVDLDADGRPDIFVGNDSTADQLYRNLGRLRFAEVGVAAGVATSGQGAPQATMGVGLADVDGNGLPDLFVTVFSDDTNTLHRNLGGGLFADASAAFGLGAPSRPYLGWGCGFFDFDLDGDEDLLIANGHVYPEMADPQVGGAGGGWAQRPLLFERRGGRFEVVPCAAGTWCDQPMHGRAVAFGDLDGDRDVDVLMTTLNGPVRLLRNEAPPRASLVVRVADPPPNRHGFGEVIEVESPTGVQRRWLTGGGSYQAVDAPAAYFGFGDPSPDTRVTVRVLDASGRRRQWTGVGLGQVFVTDAGAATAR